MSSSVIVASEFAYSVPDSVVRHLIIGLVLGSGYDVATRSECDALIITIRSGSRHQADGGVLDLDIRG